MQTKSKLLVFPTSRSIREYINLQKEFNTLLPSILTMDEFFKKSLFFHDKKYIDEEERFLYLKQAVKNIDLQALGISANFIQFIKQSEYIYRFFLELSSENVDIETISSVDTYGYYSEHLNILKQIRKNYLKILDKNDAIDKINISKYYKINSDFLKRYSEIEINFEGYFTSFEFEIIKKISTLTNLEINFIYNIYNKKSIEKFINYGLILDIGYKYKIDFSNKVIIQKQELITKVGIRDIKGFSSRINQISFIKKSIATLVNEGISPSKIALILPDENFTSTITLFDEEGYFNYAMGLNIYTSNLYKIIDAIYLYMNESEIKNIKNLEFLGYNKDIVDSLFKNNWKRILDEDIFEQIIEFVIQNESNKELIEKFHEVIYRFKRLLFSSDEKILLKDAYKIFHKKVSKISLDDINSGKVTVMGLLESRLINFDAVIICDFNESLIPKRSLKDKFLSTSIKQKVNLPTSLDRENLQKYYYDRLISNSKNIFISYVKNNSEQISRFANTIFDLKIDETLYDNYYKHILYKKNNLNHFDKEIVLDINLLKITWSASSLKEFLDCKRKYYLKHILKVKEHDISLKPKGYELGNIVHNSLEKYYKQDDLSYKKLLDIFNKISLRDARENSFLNLNLEIWKRKLKDFVKLEEQRFEEKYKIVELEKPFLIEYENIKLRGTIDRVDKKDNEYFVIDYKTSSSLKVNTKRTFKKSTDFQLEFYYLAVEQLYKTSNIKTYYYDLHDIKLVEEIVLDEKLELLREIFKTFDTKDVNFSKCEDKIICMYCSYRTICER